jgi:hypothetical protein
MPALNIQIPVVDVQQPYLRPAPQRSDLLYWMAVGLLIGLIAYLIYLYWDRIACLFRGCPRVQRVDMLDHGCGSYMDLYCNCCAEPIRVCCTDPWVQQHFSHWSTNPQFNQLLLDGACQRLFGDRSAQHQPNTTSNAQAPPCHARPTPLGPAVGPAPGPAPNPTPTPTPVPFSPPAPTPMGVAVPTAPRPQQRAPEPAGSEWI